jgi:hypothetical protein
MMTMPQTETEEKKAKTKAMRQIEEDADQDLRDWIRDECGGSANIQVEVTRKTPKRYKGIQTDGLLTTYEEPISKEEIRDGWGGGKFYLTVKRKKPNGGFEYVTHKTISIAGPPRIDMYDDGAPQPISADSEDPSLAEKAMEMSQRQLERAEERAEKARGNGAGQIDPALVSMFENQIEAGREETRALRDELASARADMMAMATKPAEETAQDRIFEKMVDGESARIDALRAQHDSELRTIKENHASEIKMLREQHRDDLKAQAKIHDREIDMMRDSHSSRVTAEKTGYDARVDALKTETKRLDRELTEAKAELGALRLKKDMTLPEKMGELVTIKSSMQELGLVPEEGAVAEKGTAERIFEAVMNSKAAENVAERLAGGVAAAAGGEPAAQLPPPGQPFQMPGDPNVYVVGPDGTVGLAQPPPRRKKKEKPPEDGITPPGPEEVSAAVEFMENAVVAGTSPEEFATTASALIPAGLLAYIRSKGVDALLDNVAKLDASSVLNQQNGRNFARKVGKLLQGGLEE